MLYFILDFDREYWVCQNMEVSHATLILFISRKITPFQKFWFVAQKLIFTFRNN